MDQSIQLAIKNISRLIRSSEAKFRKGNFEGSIIDKKKTYLILKSNSNSKILFEKFKEELSNLYISKFDLIFDHKLKIDEVKKSAIIKNLRKKSEEKLKIGDFKGSIKALRRSEKYFIN